jgi:N-acetylglucosaminyldiphosphoundecaprenol N-acetyl-beta-D-mannosaminyltransferase
MPKLNDLMLSLGPRLVRSQDAMTALALDGTPKRIQTVNVHHLYLARKSSAFESTIKRADYVTADGWPVAWALSGRGRSTARVTGADLVESIVTSNKSARLALIGASAEVGDGFASLLEPTSLQLVFREHGRASDWDSAGIVSQLNALSCELALVAVTPPLGDQIAENLRAAGFQGTVVAVGGAIDMVTGEKRRAGGMWQRVGLEWAFRFLQEPKRLFVRYFVQCVPILAIELLPARLDPRRI